MKTIYMMCLSALMFLSCKKENVFNDNPQEDIEAPVILMSAPLDGETIAFGENLRIKAKIQENNDLHGVMLTVNKVDDSSLIFFMNQHKHGQVYNIDTVVELPKERNVLYRIRLHANDHDDNENLKELIVKVE